MRLLKAYLERYFNTIKLNFGHFDNYHMQGLNLSTDFKDKMRQIYLVLGHNLKKMVNYLVLQTTMQ